MLTPYNPSPPHHKHSGLLLSSPLTSDGGDTLAIDETQPRVSQRPHLALGGPVRAQASLVWGGLTAWRGRPGDTSCKQHSRSCPPWQLTGNARARLVFSPSTEFNPVTWGSCRSAFCELRTLVQLKTIPVSKSTLDPFSYRFPNSRSHGPPTSRP